MSNRQARMRRKFMNSVQRCVRLEKIPPEKRTQAGRHAYAANFRRVEKYTGPRRKAFV